MINPSHASRNVDVLCVSPRKKMGNKKEGKKKGMGERCITNGGRQCAPPFFLGHIIKP
jgi:hypothetical protein